jgi:hydroxymethylglutaryl-CoA reductase
MPVLSSRIAGFHQLTPSERLQKVADLCELDAQQVESLSQYGNLPENLASHMVENVAGAMTLPLGIATNMIIDGEEVLIPMVTEESSVIAAVCNAAKQCRSTGGFITSTSGSEMIAQIQLLEVSDPEQARLKILEQKDTIQALCDEVDPVLLKHGGGFRDLEVRVFSTPSGPMVVTHLIVDTRDAMGANAVNSMAEQLAPEIARWTGGRVNLRILSNLADRRLARARAVWTCDEIGGPDVRDGILSASQFAQADPYRATTHNKGIMNGVTAVVLATGNDTRAVEAGAHAYAARSGQYRGLSCWERTAEGDLAGTLELPLAVGLIGGATKLHPTAQTSLKILGVQNASALARCIAAVGLAQNFAALKALATTGIQKGHMALHAQNIAMMAGAQGDEIETVAQRLVEESQVRLDIAEVALAELRGKR